MKSVQGDFGLWKAYCNTQAIKHSSVVEGVKGAGLCFVRRCRVRPAIGRPLGRGVFLSTISCSLLLLSSIPKALKRFPSGEAIEKAAVKGLDSLYYLLLAHWPGRNCSFPCNPEFILIQRLMRKFEFGEQTWNPLKVTSVVSESTEMSDIRLNYLFKYVMLMHLQHLNFIYLFIVRTVICWYGKWGCVCTS